jgi:hypothetical protein
MEQHNNIIDIHNLSMLSLTAMAKDALQNGSFFIYRVNVC